MASQAYLSPISGSVPGKKLTVASLRYDQVRSATS
jgi:hypothetical protein